MNNRFNNQVVLITGAVGALGEVVAYAFAREGATVVVAARREAEGMALANALGNQALFVALEVADETSWTVAINRIESQVDPVSVLVNNATYLAVGGVETVSVNDWRRVVDTNLTGSFLSIRAVAPFMRKAGGGSIVNMSSIAGLHPTPNRWPTERASGA